jgi:hypothetical protein
MSTAPRFEFRAFGRHEPGRSLARPARRLAALGRPLGEDERDEIYLVGPDLTRNVKIRAGTLEVKRLLGVTRGLERWAPVARVELPVDADWMRERLPGLFPGAPAWPPSPGRERYDALAFAREVQRVCPGVDAVPVHKHRERRAWTRVLGERTSVWIGASRLQTLALESEDPESVLAWVRGLGLDAFPNESYPRAVRRHLERGEADVGEGPAWPSSASASSW